MRCRGWWGCCFGRRICTRGRLHAARPYFSCSAQALRITISVAETDASVGRDPHALAVRPAVIECPGGPLERRRVPERY